MRVPDAIDRLYTCPHCGKGRPIFNRWWFVNVDTTLYCSHCKSRLFQINYIGTAVLFALAITMLYFSFQNQGAHGTIQHAKNMLKVYAVLYFLWIAVARLVLAYLLWMLKNLPNIRKKQEPSEGSE